MLRARRRDQGCLVQPLGPGSLLCLLGCCIHQSFSPRVRGVPDDAFFRHVNPNTHSLLKESQKQHLPGRPMSRTPYTTLLALTRSLALPCVSGLATSFGPRCGNLRDVSSLRVYHGPEGDCPLLGGGKEEGILPSWLGDMDFCYKCSPSGKCPGAVFQQL